MSLSLLLLLPHSLPLRSRPLLLLSLRRPAALPGLAYSLRASLQPPIRILLTHTLHALLAFAPLALVGTDARPPALLAFAPSALMGADARAPTLLALAPSALVRTDARPPALLASAPLALVRTDARPPALLALAPLALVRTLRGLLLCHSAALLLAFSPIAFVRARVFLLWGTVARLFRNPSTTPLLLPLCRPAALLRLDWRGSLPLRSTTHFAALCCVVRALLVLFEAAFHRYYQPEGAVPMAVNSVRTPHNHLVVLAPSGSNGVGTVDRQCASHTPHNPGSPPALPRKLQPYSL